jgi:hypothetical protein
VCTEPRKEIGDGEKGEGERVGVSRKAGRCRAASPL